MSTCEVKELMFVLLLIFEKKCSANNSKSQNTHEKLGSKISISRRELGHQKILPDRNLALQNQAS